MKTQIKYIQQFEYQVGHSQDYVAWQHNPAAWLGQPRPYWIAVRPRGQADSVWEPWAWYNTETRALQAWHTQDFVK